jgi:hypothetical protein
MASAEPPELNGVEPVPLVGTEIEKSFPQQLREDLVALLIAQIKQPSRLRQRQRQTAHIAELPAHALDQLLIGGPERRRPPR